jgi:hypothetical protein
MMSEFEKTVWRARIELPHPLNYTTSDNEGLAYILMRLVDMRTKGGV